MLALFLAISSSLVPRESILCSRPSRTILALLEAASAAVFPTPLNELIIFPRGRAPIAPKPILIAPEVTEAPVLQSPRLSLLTVAPAIVSVSPKPTSIPTAKAGPITGIKDTKIEAALVIHPAMFHFLEAAWAFNWLAYCCFSYSS